MDNIKNDSYYIQKILSDLEFMIEHTKGLSKEEIQADDVLLDSIMFRIIQVAENSDRLSEKFKDIHDDLPWKDIKGMRNRIVHDYGNNTSIASVHCEVDDNLTSRDIHVLSKRIEKEVYIENGTILTIGIYASNNNDDCQEIKKDIITIIRDINGVKQYHGFYLDEELKIISFDLVIDISIKDPYPIIKEVKDKLNEIYKDYEIFIALDRDYSD